MCCPETVLNLPNGDDGDAVVRDADIDKVESTWDFPTDPPKSSKRDKRQASSDYYYEDESLYEEAYDKENDDYDDYEDYYQNVCPEEHTCSDLEQCAEDGNLKQFSINIKIQYGNLY